MTDRINAITVVLENDIRDDDAEALLNAIRMIRGVLSVEPHIADSISATVTEMRIRNDLRKQLYQIIESL